jgi:hypothetical protein
MWPNHIPTGLPYRIAAGLGIGAVVLAAIPLLIRLAWPPENGMAPGDNTPPISGAVVNQRPGTADPVEQKSGITAETVNVTPPRAGFTDEIGPQLLTQMPEKKKVVVLNTMGGPADQRVGREVQDFLQKNGYEVQRFRSNVLVPRPDRPFTFVDSPDSYIVTVAPGAR